MTSRSSSRNPRTMEPVRSVERSSTVRGRESTAYPQPGVRTPVASPSGGAGRRARGTGLVDRPQPLRRLVEHRGLRQRGEDRAARSPPPRAAGAGRRPGRTRRAGPGRDRGPAPPARWPSSRGRRGSGSAAPGSWCRRRRPEEDQAQSRVPPTAGRRQAPAAGRRVRAGTGRAECEGRTEDGGQHQVGGVARVVAEDAPESGTTGEHEGEVDEEVATTRASAHLAPAPAPQQHDHDDSTRRPLTTLTHSGGTTAPPRASAPRSAHHAGQGVLEDVGGGECEVLARRDVPASTVVIRTWSQRYADMPTTRPATAARTDGAPR